jgi:hypothetical protein
MHLNSGDTRSIYAERSKQIIVLELLQLEVHGYCWKQQISQKSPLIVYAMKVFYEEQKFSS